MKQEITQHSQYRCLKEYSYFIQKGILSIFFKNIIISMLI